MRTQRFRLRADLPRFAVGSIVVLHLIYIFQLSRSPSSLRQLSRRTLTTSTSILTPEIEDARANLHVACERDSLGAVLVTGAASAVGHAIASELVKCASKMVVGDDLVRNGGQRMEADTVERRLRLAQLVDLGCLALQPDLRQPTVPRLLLAEHGPFDLVVHVSDRDRVNELGFNDDSKRRFAQFHEHNALVAAIGLADAANASHVRNSVLVLQDGPSDTAIHAAYSRAADAAFREFVPHAAIVRVDNLFGWRQTLMSMACHSPLGLVGCAKVVGHSAWPPRATASLLHVATMAAYIRSLSIGLRRRSATTAMPTVRLTGDDRLELSELHGFFDSVATGLSSKTAVGKQLADNSSLSVAAFAAACRTRLRASVVSDVLEVRLSTLNLRQTIKAQLRDIAPVVPVVDALTGVNELSSVIADVKVTETPSYGILVMAY